MRQKRKLNRKMIVSSLSVLLSLCILPLSVSAAQKTAPAKKAVTATSYVATVGTDGITKEEFRVFLKNAERDLVNSVQFDITDWNMKIQNSTLAEIAKQNALDYAVEFKILYRKAVDAKLALTAKETSDVDSGTSADIKGLGVTAKDQQNALNAICGMTVDQIKALNRQHALAVKFVSMTTNNYKISDSDLKAFFEANKKAYDKVTVAHILFSTVDNNHQPLPQDKQELAKKNADDVLALAKAPGSDFAALAKQYSEDPASKDNGGEYTIQYNHQMVPEFENWAFDPSRKVGDTEIVKTVYGYHVMKLVRTVSFDEIKNDVKTGLQTKKFTDDLAAWEKDKKYKVVKNDAVLKTIQVP